MSYGTHGGWEESIFGGSVLSGKFPAHFWSGGQFTGLLEKKKNVCFKIQRDLKVNEMFMKYDKISDTSW